MIERIGTWGVCGALLVMMASAGCKTSEASKQEEEPVDEASVLTQELSTIEKVERIPPGERTFKDDMLLVCYSPTRIDQTAEGEARTSLLSEYISNNIYTPDALEFFQEMSTMDVETRDVFFEKKVNQLGLVRCPFLDETRQRDEPEPVPEQDLTLPVDPNTAEPKEREAPQDVDELEPDSAEPQ